MSLDGGREEADPVRLTKAGGCGYIKEGHGVRVSVEWQCRGCRNNGGACAGSRYRHSHFCHLSTGAAHTWLVCLGDRVVVNVKNLLHSDGLTMHWHGLTMRGSSTTDPDSPAEGTPYMDGTPGITQCAIPARSTFKYSFIASNAGTHFYHSHAVREPAANDPNRDTYDYDLSEHVILVSFGMCSRDGDSVARRTDIEYICTSI
ncbi:L-ascorbate oxidase [Portunus trituberculatus]|uniref:L-ascorbate oxidase n=1 Tax=Portunus trituberculatus TaxID=210409 RepID=A0A5B7CLF5_PORTR|nr:L-ascorbate oxidase [Portunus trituberculatus]